MIASLIKLDVSYFEIQCIFGCGKGRICKVNDPEAYRIKHSKSTPGHAITAEDKEMLIEFLESLDTQQGFACAHRLPQTYLTEEGLTWSVLFGRYKLKQLARKPPGRVISIERWRQFRRVMYPRLHLSRNRQDLCDTCEKIRIQLQNPDLNEEDRKVLELELKTHLKPAQDQRRAWS